MRLRNAVVFSLLVFVALTSAAGDPVGMTRFAPYDVGGLTTGADGNVYFSLRGWFGQTGIFRATSSPMEASGCTTSGSRAAACFGSVGWRYRL